MAIDPLNGAGSAANRSGGRFRRALRRMMSSREVQARRYVNDYLMMHDDARLATFSIERKTASMGIHGYVPW